jgi:hypothetical protein
VTIPSATESVTRELHPNAGIGRDRRLGHLPLEAATVTAGGDEAERGAMTEMLCDALASALHASRPSDYASKAELWQWRSDCRAVMEVCSAGEPSFDPARFLRVCETGAAS